MALAQMAGSVALVSKGRRRLPLVCHGGTNVLAAAAAGERVCGTGPAVVGVCLEGFLAAEAGRGQEAERHAREQQEACVIRGEASRRLREGTEKTPWDGWARIGLGPVAADGRCWLLVEGREIGCWVGRDC